MKPKMPERDSVTTINEDGSRYFVHPADVRGAWTRWRSLAAWVLIGVYVALPLVKIGDAPAVFLDVVGRKFHLFGLTLMFQDTWLLFFLITGTGFSLFLVTALVGRVWCGWGCPQTVFLDHVFRRIERWIDGDAPARRRLEDAPMSAGKAARRLIKHGIFVGLSLAIAHIFISYFVSVPRLYEMMRHSPVENWGLFVFVSALTGILYFNFAWFREQFCIVMCPYGRLQSVLIDDHSIVIGYDERRGEPRGKLGTVAGDCIDCRRCVQVCPTGIDIRQGLQIECIACEACIDACDEIMLKVGRPRGLIRHDSLNAFAGRVSRFLRPRVFLYGAFALLGASVFTFAATRVEPVALSVTRMPGSPYVRDEVQVRNNFLVRIANKRPTAHSFTLEVEGAGVAVQVAGASAKTLRLLPGEEVIEPLILVVPDADFPGPFDVKVRAVGESGSVEAERRVPFLGPFRQR